jgi:hypothetical protein
VATLVFADRLSVLALLSGAAVLVSIAAEEAELVLTEHRFGTVAIVLAAIGAHTAAAVLVLAARTIEAVGHVATITPDVALTVAGLLAAEDVDIAVASVELAAATVTGG